MDTLCIQSLISFFANGPENLDIFKVNKSCFNVYALCRDIQNEAVHFKKEVEK